MSKRKPSPNPVGRPEAQIDWTLFEQLCGIQCTMTEMAGMLKVHRDTLSDQIKKKYNADFSTVYEKYAQDGKCSLRRHQFVLSKTNAAMAIWLGKNWLGQKEPESTQHIPPNDGLLNTLLEQIKHKDTLINELKPKANPEFSRSY